MSARPLDETIYLIVEGKRSTWGPIDRETGLRSVDSISVGAIRKNRPKVLARDEVAVRIKVVLPPGIFEMPVPLVTITVPEDFVIHGPIEAEVLPPEES